MLSHVESLLNNASSSNVSNDITTGDENGGMYSQVGAVDSKDRIKNMMRGTNAVEQPEQSVHRVVVTRQLTRRQSLRVEESVKKDNLRCDAQLSSVFLKCMYDSSDEDSDSFDGSENKEEEKRLKKELKRTEKIKNESVNKDLRNNIRQGDKENVHLIDINIPDKATLSTSEIILRSTVPPWEAVRISESGNDQLGKKERSWLHRNTQVTVGAKPFRSEMRLQDRIAMALDIAKEKNCAVKDNTVRTHFGFYYDTDEDEVNE